MMGGTAQAGDTLFTGGVAGAEAGSVAVFTKPRDTGTEPVPGGSKRGADDGAAVFSTTSTAVPDAPLADEVRA